MKFVEVGILFDVFTPDCQTVRRLINLEHVSEISFEPHSEVNDRLINFFYMASGCRHWVSAEDHSLMVRAVGGGLR
jgi:hypothetical protein